MPFITQGKTNLKYILIIVVLFIITGGGVLGYQYWLTPLQPPLIIPLSTPTLTPSLLTPIPQESYIEIISPNGREEWVIGETYTIKWNASGYAPTAEVNIVLRYDIEDAVITSTTNTGSYSWTVPDGLGEIPTGVGNAYKIIIYINGDWPQKFDLSDDYFSVKEKECSIIIPESIDLKAKEIFGTTPINSDYLKLNAPEDLCVLSYPPGITGYYIVQFKGKDYKKYRSQIQALGGEQYSFIPNNAYIVKMDDKVKNEMQNLADVRWIGVMQPAYKIQSILIGKTGDLPLVVSFYDGYDPEGIADKIESLGGTTVVTPTHIRVDINSSMINSIANIVGVEYIEHYFPATAD